MCRGTRVFPVFPTSILRTASESAREMGRVVRVSKESRLGGGRGVDGKLMSHPSPSHAYLEELSRGSRRENVEMAIAHYNAALEVFTKEALPAAVGCDVL